jgi:hypothetical protein
MRPKGCRGALSAWAVLLELAPAKNCGGRRRCAADQDEENLEAKAVAGETIAEIDEPLVLVPNTSWPNRVLSPTVKNHRE